jgi:hypothetical protein
LKYKWFRNDVDLDLLKKDIDGFLENKGFKIRQLDSDDPNARELFGILRTPESDLRSATVIITKASDGFEVELKAGEQSRSILKLSSVLTFFGGGSLLLKGYKSAEFYQKLEEEFWTYVEKKVEGTDSSGVAATF